MGKFKLSLGDDPKEKKKNIARAIILVLAVVVAVVAFTKAVLSVSYKEPGYYKLDAAVEEGVPAYGADVEFIAYFEGTANEVKLQIRTADKLYSDSLLWAYKMFNAKELFPGYTNLASVNSSVKDWDVVMMSSAPYSSVVQPAYQSPEFQFAPQVYNAILDAYEKTCRQCGYNLFAGALYDAWKEILILDDAAAFDPINDSYQAERIEKLAAASSSLSNFRVEIASASQYKLRFTVSESYVRLLEELECDINIIDLNLLHDSYMMQEVFSRMQAEGYEDCVIQGSNGLIAANGRNIGSESSFSRVPVEDSDIYYYTVKDASGKEHYRSLFFNVYTGEQFDIAEYTKVDMIGKFELLDTVWLNLQLSNAKDADELKAIADKINAMEGVSAEYKLY